MPIGDPSGTLSSKPHSDKPAKSYYSMEAPDDDSTGDADAEDSEMDNGDVEDSEMDDGDDDDDDDDDSQQTTANPNAHINPSMFSGELAQGDEGDEDIEDYNVAKDVERFCREKPEEVKELLENQEISGKESNVDRVTDHAQQEQVKYEENLLDRELEHGVTPQEANMNVDARLHRERNYDEEYAKEKTEEFIEAMDHAKGTAMERRENGGNDSGYSDVDM